MFKRKKKSEVKEILQKKKIDEINKSAVFKNPLFLSAPTLLVIYQHECKLGSQNKCLVLFRALNCPK